MPIRVRTESLPAQRETTREETDSARETTSDSTSDESVPWIMSVAVRKGYDEFMNWWDA